MKSATGAIALFCMALAPWGTARANPILFTWAGSYRSGGVTHPLDGSVTFDTIADSSGGYDLVITLENTAPEATPGSAWILDGLYFNILQGTNTGIGGTSPGALTPISATAYELATVGNTSPYPVTYGSPGASICASAHPGYYGCSTNTVAGGWEAIYRSGGISTGQHWAIGTTTQGLFKNTDVGGINYGITPSAGIQGASWSAGQKYTHQYATFTLKGLSNSAIFVTQVTAAYGTGPNTTINGVLIYGEAPEPHALLTTAAGAILLAALGRRRRHPRGL